MKNMLMKPAKKAVVKKKIVKKKVKKTAVKVPKGDGKMPAFMGGM